MFIPSDSFRSPRLLAIGALVLVLGVTAAFLAWRHLPRGSLPVAAPPADPRLAYTGRFLNVHPDVDYVGSAVCGECHVAETKSYRAHPMGRSLALIADIRGQIPSADENTGFLAFGSRFHLVRQGERLWQHQTRLDAAARPIYTLESEVQYVIGSGTRGYSFLSERGGYLFQTAISWFSQRGVWGLSPGFTPAQFPGRPITAECLYCHAHRLRPRPDTDNGCQMPIFDEHAIGCERCHGPGQRHVQERRNGVAIAGAIDCTIFNPTKKQKQVEPSLRDAVCEQCHLSGEVRVRRRGRDLYVFRPGLPLHLFWSVFVRDRRTEGQEKAVNHVEQMHLSRCYQESSGAAKLECVSCHNPHESVAAPRRIYYYRARCLECHAERGCALPRAKRLLQSKEDSCIDCHMPRYAAADIPHTAATDHRIVRRRDLAATPEQVIPSGTGERGGRDFLKSFYGGDPAGDRELARDLAVALMQLAAEGKGEPPLLARQVLDLLGESLTNYPDDFPAWEARGTALAVLGRTAEALSTFERVLEHAPCREHALRAAGQLSQDNRELDKAIDYWRRAVDINPQAAHYRGNLALLLVQRGDWGEASKQCNSWLRLDPGSLEARTLWIRCLRKQGDRQAARAEIERLRRLEE